MKLPRLFQRPEPREWFIWSTKRGAWWRPDGKGYTDRLADAGRFTEAYVRSGFAQTWPKGDDHSEPRHLTQVLEALDYDLKVSLAKLAHERRRIAELVVLKRVIRRAGR